MTSQSSSVTKAFALLEIIAARPRPWGISELSRKAGLNKSNIHRLLQTLVALSYVRFLPETSKYQATLKLWEVGVQVAAGFDIRRLAPPHMTDLVQQIKQTVHLSVLEGCEIVYIDRIEARATLIAQVDVGSRAPAQCVATGLAIMAFLPEERLQAWDRELEQPTERSPRSLDDVRKWLDVVRDKGYARTRGSWRKGVLGLAAPVFNIAGEVIGAIGMSCVDLNITDESETEMAGHVMQAAARLSDELGYQNGKV